MSTVSASGRGPHGEKGEGGGGGGGGVAAQERGADNPPGTARGKPRNVAPFDPRQLPEQCVPLSTAPFPILHTVDDLQDRLLTVADQKGVEELRHGRRVEGADASPQDERGGLPAVP